MLAHLSGIRGMDSTGLVLASRFKKSPRVWMEKDTIDPCNFFDENPEVFKGNVSTVVGHCRAATVGSVNIKNAHPYHYGRILGVHNGTIGQFAPDKDTDRTDSSILYERMNRDGVIPTLQAARFGAYALVWVNVQDNTLNFIRNDQRPLYFMKSKANTWYWASEKRMLEFIAQNPNNYEEPFLLKANTLVTFQLGGTQHKLTENYVPEVVFKLDPPTKYCKDCYRTERFCICHKEDKEKVVVPFLPDKRKTPPTAVPVTKTATTGGKNSSQDGSKRLIHYLYDENEWTLCSECHQEEQQCNCPGTFDKSTFPQVVDYTQYANAEQKAEADKKKKPFDPADQAMDMYQGYNNFVMSIPTAKQQLACGCGWCGKVKGPEDRVVWTEPKVYWCNSKQCQDAMAQMYAPMHPQYPSDVVEV